MDSRQVGRGRFLRATGAVVTAGAVVIALAPTAAAADVTVRPGSLNGWKMVVEGGTAQTQRTVDAGWTTGGAQLSPTDNHTVGVMTNGYDGTDLDEVTALSVSFQTTGSENPRVLLRTVRPEGTCSVGTVLSASGDALASDGWRYFGDNEECPDGLSGAPTHTWGEVKDLLPGAQIDGSGVNYGVRIINGENAASGYGVATVASATINSDVVTFAAPVLTLAGQSATVDAGESAQVPITVTLSGLNQPTTYNSGNFITGSGGLDTAGTPEVNSSPQGVCTLSAEPVLFEPVENERFDAAVPPKESTLTVQTAAGQGGECTISLGSLENAEAEGTVTVQVNAPGAPTTTPPTTTPPSASATPPVPPASTGTAPDASGDTIDAPPVDGVTEYQWYMCDEDGENCVAVEGATGEDLTIPPGSEGMTFYRVATTPDGEQATPLSEPVPSEGSGSGSGDGDGSGSGSGDGDDNGSGGSSTGGDDNGSGSGGSGSGGSAEETPSAVPGGNGAPSDGVGGAWLLVIAAFGSAGAIAWYLLMGRRER